MRELGCGAGVTVGLFDGVDSMARHVLFFTICQNWEMQIVQIAGDILTLTLMKDLMLYFLSV